MTERRREQRRVGVRGRRAPTGASADRGAVTAEAAVVLPVLVGVGLLLVWLVCVAATQVRVVDAAREAARAAARDEPTAAAEAAARRVAPEGSVVSLQVSGEAVTATVQAPVRGPSGVFSFLPALVLESSAHAAREPR